MYAYILSKSQPFEGLTVAGIYSFKNLKARVINFTKKNKPGLGASKQQYITSEVLQAFENELKSLLFELFNSNISFIEKEV
jgi:hypothetical protein